jgi:hypothetical protein
MKKFAILPAILVLAGAAVFAQEPDTLNEAIKESMNYFSESLEPKTTVAVVNFSAYPTVSKYAIDKMNEFLVKNRRLTPVDRSKRELIRAEMEYQHSGEVSDKTAQALGEKYGAQTVISGSLSPFGSKWYLSIEAHEVKTGEVQGAKTYTIRKDAVLSALLPKTTGEKVGTGALNIIFGLGSYLDGDISGGLTLTAGYAGAAALFIIEGAALDWDSPAAGVPATIGITAAGLTLAYGFVRPFIHNRNPHVAAFLDNARIDVAPTSGNGFTARNGHGLRLTYTVQF